MDYREPTPEELEQIAKSGAALEYESDHGDLGYEHMQEVPGGWIAHVNLAQADADNTCLYCGDDGHKTRNCTAPQISWWCNGSLIDHTKRP